MDDVDTLQQSKITIYIYIYNRHVPIYRWFIDVFSIETFKILDIPLLATHGLREDPDEEKGIAEETMSEAEASGPLGGCTRSYPLVNIQETMVNQCKSPFLYVNQLFLGVEDLHGRA